MKAIFVFIDIITILFAAGFGVQIGSEYSPNIAALVLSFFSLRTLLLWLFFNTFIHRDFPWVRGIAQFVTLLLILPTLIFGSYFLPPLARIIETRDAFYFLVIPSLTGLISLGFQRYFKLEPWQA